MTNTHRKTTNRTTAKIAAVGAFGLGAAIAFPGLAAAEAPTDPTASLADITGEDGSLEGALGTDLNLDLGSLAFNLNLDAETPNPGSVELGSLGVSPNTGSALIDGNSGSAEDETETATGSATGSADEDATDADADSGSLGSSDETTDEPPADETAAETGSLSGSLAGLSSGAEDDADADATTVGADAEVEADAGLNFGSLG